MAVLSVPLPPLGVIGSAVGMLGAHPAEQRTRAALRIIGPAGPTQRRKRPDHRAGTPRCSNGSR